MKDQLPGTNTEFYTRNDQMVDGPPVKTEEYQTAQNIKMPEADDVLPPNSGEDVAKRKEESNTD